MFWIRYPFKNIHYLTFIFILWQVNNSLSQTGLILKFYSGYSFHQPATFKMNLLNHYYKIENVRSISGALQLPLYYGFSVKYRIHQGTFPIDLGIEFLHDKFYVQRHLTVLIQRSDNPDFPPKSEIPFEKILNRFSMSHGYNFILAKLSIPVSTSILFHRKLVFNASLAGGGSIPHVESQKGNVKIEKYQWHFPAIMAEMNSEWYFSRKGLFFLGAKMIGSRLDHAEIAGGHLSAWIWSWHIFAGLGISNIFFR